MSWGSAGEGRVNAAMWGEFFFFFFTFHESAQRKRKFVPRLFVYSLYTFSSPDGLRSSGLYFSSACLACFFFLSLLRRKMSVGGERGFQRFCSRTCLDVLYILEGRVLLKSISTSPGVWLLLFPRYLFVCLSVERISTERKMESWFCFVCPRPLNSGMSWGAQHNLKGPVLEINWHIQSNGGSTSPK